MNPAYLFPVFASMTWGIIYTLDQRILKSTSTFTFLLIDAVITIIIFLPILFLKKDGLQELTQLNRSSIMLIVITVLLTILADVLILLGVKHLNASMASIIEISYPFFVVLFSFLLYRTTLSLPTLLGGLLIFLGSALIVKYGS